MTMTTPTVTVTLTEEEHEWLAALVLSQLRLTSVKPNADYLSWCGGLYAKLMEAKPQTVRRK